MKKTWQQLKNVFPLGGLGHFARLTDQAPNGFLGNVGWQYGGTLAGSALSFIYAILVAGALGRTEFGLMALGLAFVNLVSLFANVKLREVVIRYIAKFWAEDDKPRTLAMTKLSLLLDLAGGVAAMALIMILAPLGKMFLIRDERAFLIIAVAGCAYVFQNVADDTALGLLRVFGRFRVLAITEVLAAALKLAGVLGVILLLGWGILGVLLIVAVVNLAINVIRLALALAELHRHVPLRSHAPIGLLRPYRTEIKRFFGFNYLRSISSFGTRELDINILGLFTSAGSVGVYKLARSFSVVLYQFADAAFLVAYPEIAKLWSQKAFSQLWSFIRRLAAIMAGSGTVLYAAAFFAVPWLVKKFVSPEFIAAGSLFRLMGWGILLWSPFIWVGPLLLAAGRPDLMLRCSLGSGIGAVVLYLVACPLFGAPGAAVVSATTHAIGVAIALWSARNAGIFLSTEETHESAGGDAE